MPRTQSYTVNNNFTKGLITEASSLTFPKDACTETYNCIHTLTGPVKRRLGIDYEDNYTAATVDRTDSAISEYIWTNAGGDGNTQLYVLQIGATLYFYTSSAATNTTPLSGQKLASTVDISSFLAAGSSADPSLVECQYSDGNGYLIVYNSACEPFYCIYAAGTITASQITLKIRDFVGIPETGVVDNYRSSTLTTEHQYNLQNQGWSTGSAWVIYPTGNYQVTLGSHTFSVSTSGATGITIGQNVNINMSVNDLGTLMIGVVTAYTATTITVNVTIYNTLHYLEFWGPGGWSIFPTNSGFITDWNTAVGNYPSNADVWWLFKDTSGAYNPAVTAPNVVLPSAPAPKGFYVLSAFSQTRGLEAGLSGITDISTTTRPRTGTWFQGRVWYAGVDASFQASGDQPYTTWTENLYFSQIITDITKFGLCYQTNDPTSENLFDLLPSDGGVITIQGSGSIYKLFPVQNGLLVFAANGIWFITGSQGIGFSANDYTITKISAVKSISSTSFVDVQGTPIFWNLDGIYSISFEQNGLKVNCLTLDTIKTFYNSIPLDSKKYARGSYDPINNVVKWVYRSTQETSTTNRYEFDRVLNLNIYLKAFYIYSISGTPTINGVMYVSGPGGISDASTAKFKYLTSAVNGGSYDITFSEEKDTNYVDWYTYDTTGVDFTSYFITGYSLQNAMTDFQSNYVMYYQDNNSVYDVQGIWDFSNSGDSGRWTQPQRINTTSETYYDYKPVRRKIRGRGKAMQTKIISVSGYPFNISGWAVFLTGNQTP